MIHFPHWLRRHRAAASAVVTPLTPAAYLRLRRNAAGVSIEQVAARIAPALHDRSNARLLIEMLETDGSRARDRQTIDRLAAAYPLDPDVYFQLVNEPADRHPPVCRGCGCSHWDPCNAGDGVACCAWATPTSCTRCEDAASGGVR